jgi:hypothetical protein
MTRPPRSLSFLAVLGLAAPGIPLAAATPAPPAGGVAIFVGPSGGVGDVRFLDENGSARPSGPPELRGIRLLPIELSGRTQLEELLPGRARLRADVPGAARLALPAGAGSLYRYERVEAGGAVFGYFVVDAEGRPRSVFEMSGTGPGAATDPIPLPVAVDAVGGAILVATTPAAGGDLIEVDLATASAHVRTAAIAPRTFATGGLRLLAGWGVGASAEEVLRFDRQSAAQAAALDFPGGAPALLQGDVVASGDGLMAATLAGAGPSALHVFAFGPSGTAVQVTSASATLSSAGFLPGALGGPYLALSQDGSCAAWRSVEVPTPTETSREAWIRPVSAPHAEVQVTADANFIETLDEAGQFLFFGAGDLVVMVGERDSALGDVEGGDFYRVALGAAGQIALTNLSLTSGDTQPPFIGGTLKSEGGVFQVDGFPGVLMHDDQSSGTGSLRSVNFQTGVLQTLLPSVDTLEAVEIVGSHFALALERTSGAQELLRLPLDLSASATVLASLPGNFSIRPLAPRPDGTLGLLVGPGTGLEWLARVDVPSGASTLLLPTLLPLGPTLATSPQGALATSVDLPSGSVFGLWSAGGALGAFSAGGATSFLLPGI